MKKLFVLICLLILSTNAFSWGKIPCDEFLDQRKSNNKEVKTIHSLLSLASYNFFLLGAYTTPSKEKREVLSALLTDPPITVNQMLYLIENGCREQPTGLVTEVAAQKYLIFLLSEFKKKNINLND